jgi:hypothetical protein
VYSFCYDRSRRPQSNRAARKTKPPVGSNTNRQQKPKTRDVSTSVRWLLKLLTDDDKPKTLPSVTILTFLNRAPRAPADRAQMGTPQPR